MATKMFDRYPQPGDIAPETPNNHPHCVDVCPFYDTIVRGTTPKHSFELPYDMEEDQGFLYGEVKDLIVTYKQGLEIILTKQLSKGDIDYIDKTENDHSIIYYTLTEDETNKFKVTNPNNLVQVQIKIELNAEIEAIDNGHDILVTPIMLMNVLPEINGEKMNTTED